MLSDATLLTPSPLTPPPGAGATALRPGDALDRYQVEGLLGRGGMGVVYRARHLHLDTACALKLMRVEDAEIARRMLQEARRQSRLRHPNVVGVSDFFLHDGAPVIVMELVEGGSLRAALRAGPLPLERADALAEGLLAGVGAAHAAGLVHRDVKPDNVLLEPGPAAAGGGAWTPRLTDFGLVKAVAAPGRSRVVGTPGYMAPEQYLDPEAVDARADLYSVGVVLYEALTGRRLSDAESFGEHLQAAHTGGHDDPRALRPDLPARMAAALAAALEPEPERRVESAPSLLAIWRGERASAPPPTNLPARSDAFVGRAAALAALAAALDAGPVTVLGPAGVGKTRLVQRFAADRRVDYPGGVWFCALSSARTLQDIAAPPAGALSLRLTRGDPLERLGHALAGRGRALVVLDNFEHLLEHAPATVGAWRDAAPEARFVITSREPLGLEGERRLRLDPLDPAEGAALFAARAGGEPGAADVAALVSLLDGLPLAIELAARRAALLSPTEILEGLAARGDRALLLRQGRSRSGRHGTLEAAIGWSWALLDRWERAALAQCAVFRGGFTARAAEAVVDLGASGDADHRPAARGARGRDHGADVSEPDDADGVGAARGRVVAWHDVRSANPIRARLVACYVALGEPSRLHHGARGVPRIAPRRPSPPRGLHRQRLRRPQRGISRQRPASRRVLRGRLLRPRRDEGRHAGRRRGRARRGRCARRAERLQPDRDRPRQRPGLGLDLHRGHQQRRPTYRLLLFHGALRRRPGPLHGGHAGRPVRPLRHREGDR